MLTNEIAKRLQQRIEYNANHGGYILPLVRRLAVDLPECTWEQLNNALANAGHYGGYHQDVVRRAFGR